MSQDSWKEILSRHCLGLEGPAHGRDACIYSRVHCNCKFLVFIRFWLCAAERPHAFITTGDTIIQSKLFAKLFRCSIVVSASDCHSADLGSNLGEVKIQPNVLLIVIGDFFFIVNEVVVPRTLITVNYSIKK